MVPSSRQLPSVGLALDYAAHIGVTYVVTRGEDRRARAQESLARWDISGAIFDHSTLSMGMAVGHGGISTLLAFILVAFSNSYIYLTFFKVAYLHTPQPTRCLYAWWCSVSSTASSSSLSCSHSSAPTAWSTR